MPWAREYDAPLLASLANQTGGMLAVDDESMDSNAPAHLRLAAPRHGAVAANRRVAQDVRRAIAVADAPFAHRPRYDRGWQECRGDSGRGKDQGHGASGRRIATDDLDAGGPRVESRLRLSAGLRQGAHGDQGLRLITVGTPGLRETHSLLGDGAEVLAKLSGQAIATGNLETAERLATGVRRAPDDPARGP